jgi:glutathione S-transferase
MHDIRVTGFRWVPPFAQGLIRDLRVRWALQEAGLSFEVDLIDFSERDSDTHVAKHPFGMVPVFEAEGQDLFESGAIVLQIAEKSETLMPRDPNGRAATIAWMFAALNTVEPPLEALLAIDLLHGGEEWADLRRPGAIEAVNARLRPLANRLGGRDHLTGRFSAADILMTTVLRFIRHTELVAAFPEVEAYVQRCQARPAFRKALSEQIAGYARNEPVAA